MPNYKLSVSQRNHDTTGWHNSTQFQNDDINNIRILNARNDKSLNAIPSPLARIHLFEAAFSLVYQDELHGTNVSGDAYKKLVSDCFDVFELLFNWNNHIREGKDLKIVSWNRENETAILKKEFIEDRERKETELRRNQKDNQALNLTQIKGFKEHLVGETLNLFLQTGAFSQFNEIYIILLNNKPIAGTSPLTGFFTTPNDLGNINLINPIGKKNYFSRLLPFAQRDSKVKKFIYDFFVTHGINIFHDGLPIRNYLEHHANNIGNATLQLETINSTEISIFNQTITLQSNRERGVFDYFENHLVKINYRLNEDCFYTATNLKRDRKHDFLLPLTPNFFADFELSDISSKVEINEKDSGTVEVIIRKGTQTLSKTYQANRVNEQDGFLIDLKDVYGKQFNLGIFPFLKIMSNGKEEIKYNDYYRVMFATKLDENEMSEENYVLNFGKNGHIINPKEATEYNIRYEERTKFDKTNSLPVSSNYYSLNFCFDFIQINIPALSEQEIKFTIAPNWTKKELGTKQIDFAIDFGTTTTFVAYTDDPSHQSQPKRFELNETEVPIALLNRPKEKKPEFKWIDCFEHFSNLPDFSDFYEIQKQEFVPSIFDNSKYGFPFRTAVYEKKSVHPINKKSLLNANIAFAYQKEFDISLTKGQDYITNLKWNISSDDNYKSSIQCFIEELFVILRFKTVLLGGHPQSSKISWFSPLSFTESAKFDYNEVWRLKYLEVFKGLPDTHLINITESEAPYYYFSKIMSTADGTEGIQSNDSVLTLDIGGGTTDSMYFRLGKPVIGSSYHFGANVIWGNGYSEFKNEKGNGVYRNIKDKISSTLRSSQLSSGLLKSVNEFLNKDDSNFGSDEIINFWISNETESKIIDELKKTDFKFSYLLHFSAIIYHALKMLKYSNHPAPNCIIFTGNGSKYLDLIQTKNYIQKICGYFIKEVYGQDNNEPQIILPPINRKEATCFGGLYQPINERGEFKPVNYLGFENTTDSFKKYSEIDLRKEQVFEKLDYSFNEFINCLFKMNDTNELSFRRVFGIESNLTALKSFILSKSRENLSTGYDKRRKLVDGGDEITDSLFFYPIVGLVYQVNKLSREQLNGFIPKTTYFALSPDGDDSFDVSRLSTDQKGDSIFTISVDNSNPDFGEITLIEDFSANKKAMAGINSFLKTVCEFDEFPDDVNQSIEVLNTGKVEKDKETGKWLIKQKIKIQFVS